MECLKCDGQCDGYKCDLCGMEFSDHDPHHSCGDDHCMPKCKGCNEAELNCSCEF